MTTLAIIHTSPATIEPLKMLAHELMPSVAVINFVDDSILSQLHANGGDTSAVADRLIHYAQFAEQVGATIILNACSSVGEVVASMRRHVTIPIVRIDEAMAEIAVEQGQVIGVAATLATSLNPTLRLLQEKAEAVRRPVEFRSRLIDAAYQKLMSGDTSGHDVILTEALTRLASTTDTIVLAQASMARVIPSFPADIRPRFLSSPRLGMERVKATLDRMNP